MRDLKDFTKREWLQAAPLRHAIKQVRNDAWLHLYSRRTTHDLDAFLRRAAPIADRPFVAIIAFEQPWALGWLLDMAARHAVGATFAVFDNSRDPAARKAIASECLQRDVAYLALPFNRTRHGNRSHGMAMSWVFDNVIRALAPRVFGFIDHDLIPIRPVSVTDRLGDQPFFGLPVLSPWAWQLWAGYCFFERSSVAHRPLNFLYDFSQGLDTGGRNWGSLYRHYARESLRFAPIEFVDLKVSKDLPQISVQVIDECWLHIGGIGYNDNFRPKVDSCLRLAAAFDEGQTWPEILQRSQALRATATETALS